MDRPISRRDLLLGLDACAATAFGPGRAFADQMLQVDESRGACYPPGLTGLRGSHDASFEVAHQLARETRRDRGAVSEPDAGLHNLVVVGAGASGLSAAHFFRQAHRAVGELL